MHQLQICPEPSYALKIANVSRLFQYLPKLVVYIVMLIYAR